MSNEKEKILNVILLGDSLVGKTSLMNQYVKKLFYDYTLSTMGINFETKEIIVDDRDVKIRVSLLLFVCVLFVNCYQIICSRFGIRVSIFYYRTNAQRGMG